MLEHKKHSRVEKIKTIGATYMAAAGLQKQGDSLVGTVDMKKRIDNLQAVLAFAMAMQEKLEEINQQSFNSFKLRIGRLS